MDPGTGLPAGVAQWLAPGWLDGKRAMLVSVVTDAATGAGGVYASTDLRIWRQIIPEPDRLSTSVNGTETIALSDDNPGTAYLNRRGENSRRISFPIPALSVAGQFGTGGVQLAEAPNQVVISTDGGGHWSRSFDQQAAQQSLDQVTVAPRFPANSVALIAGFNGGMFRSADAGRNWRRIRPFPATEREEIGPIIFLQTARVVAVATGPGQWAPF